MSWYQEQDVKPYVPPVQGHRSSQPGPIRKTILAIVLAVVVLSSMAGLGYGIMAVTTNLTQGSSEERTTELMDAFWVQARRDGNDEDLCTAWALGRLTILRTTMDSIQESMNFTPDREVIERSFDDQCYPSLKDAGRAT